ncbi:hypothetical protein STEG23_013051 [Scotinomys teguina]
MCRSLGSWILEVGARPPRLGLYFIFPGIYTLSLLTVCFDSVQPHTVCMFIVWNVWDLNCLRVWSWFETGFYSGAHTAPKLIILLPQILKIGITVPYFVSENFSMYN